MDARHPRGGQTEEAYTAAGAAFDRLPTREGLAGLRNPRARDSGSEPISFRCWQPSHGSARSFATAHALIQSRSSV